MKKSPLLYCVAFALAAFAVPARAETLFFRPQTDLLWTTVGNWFLAGPNNTFTQAGRLPNSADDVEIDDNCNATNTSPQLVSLTVTALSTVTGGDFDVGVVNFAIPRAGSAQNGLNGTRLTVRTSMNFTLANTNLNNCEIIMQGGSFASVGATTVFVANSTIFNQGSFVLQPGAALSFGGSSNRFDNTPGADIRGNGGTTQVAGANLTLNNSGAIRADNGTLNISAGITWISVDGIGSFYPFTDNALIHVQSAMGVPAGVTTIVKGPGIVKMSGLTKIDGTLQVGFPAPARANAIQAPSEVVTGNLICAGQLSGSGTTTVISQAQLNLTTGSLQTDFAGLIDVLPGATFNVSGANDNGTGTIVMNGGAVKNQGVVNINVQELDTRNFNFENELDGVVNVKAPTGIVSSGSPAPVFTNLGTWNWVGGPSLNPIPGFSGIAANAPKFNNDGTLNVTGTGTVQLSGGEGVGKFNATATAKLKFALNKYRMKPSQAFQNRFGPDVIVVISDFGTLLNEHPDLEIPKLDLQPNGTLEGIPKMSVRYNASLSGGTIKGPGTLELKSTCVTDVSGSALKAILDEVVDNDGTVNWSGTGNIQTNDGTTWNNRSGSLFLLQEDESLTGTLTALPHFNNQAGATFKKIGGNGTSSIGINFENAGLVELQTGTTTFFNYHQIGGTLNLNGGNLGSFGGTPIIGDGGVIIGIGTIIGPFSCPACKIFPGHSPGKITFNGNMTMGNGATLQIEVAGLTTPGIDYDQIAVTGSATLGGALRVLDIDGFQPGGNDTIVPLTANSITGTFSSTNAQVNYGSTSLTVAALSTPLSQLLNISTRMRVLNGENVLIAGFIVTGSDPKKVIIRGIGPSLANVGVQGALADPTLEIHQGNTTLATNDNWKTKSDGSSQQAEIEATTIPPAHDLESALIVTLNPGAYTAVLAGNSGGTGIGLVEVYDLSQPANSQIANISTRGFVDTNDNVMIGGIIAGPSTAGSSRVVIRAIGPSLQAVGIGNPLQDPTLELHDTSGATVATNDNWKTRSDGGDQQFEVEATTVAPTNELESAIISRLSPGNYTAIVRGKNNTTGVALVEVYNLQ